MLTALRATAFLPSADPVFTDARLRIELTDAQHALVERAVTNSKGGYWLKRDVRTTDGVTKRFRLPYRAVAGVVQSIKLGSSAETAERTAARNTIYGDVVEFKTAPPAGVLVFEYYLRPSRFVAPQTAGRVTSIDVAGRQLTVNSAPDRLLGTSAPTSIVVGDRLDVVKPNGWHEVCVVNALTVFSIYPVIAFATGVDLTDVEVGDYVRAADESEWPALPDDFHRMLVNVAAANVLRAKKADAAANSLLKAEQPTMDRFNDLISPRVKDSPKPVYPSVGILRRRGRVYGSLPR